MRRMVIIIIASAALCIAPVTIAAEGGIAADPGASPEPFPTGRVIERVICAADPARSYALDLPSRYTPDRDRDEALTDHLHAAMMLECALESSMINMAQIAADPYLEPPRDKDGFRELLSRPVPSSWTTAFSSTIGRHAADWRL